ncbi:MAG: FAD-dependent oxidoreductase, partial [Mycobacterium leprae]
EKANQVLPPTDPEMAAFVQLALDQMGVEVITGDGIASFEGNGKATAVVLESGRQLAADMFILGIGVRPEVGLARTAGLSIGEVGGIQVDDHMRTSDPDIYAAGDAVEVVNLVTGKPSLIALAGPANKQGRVAGANAVGGELTFPGALGTAIVRAGDTVAAVTGLSEKAAARMGMDVVTSYNINGDHADYYPGVQQMVIKVVYERGTGRLLGAQIVGGNGVDKRADVFATAITARMTVEDLTNLDLAYAPPFGSAKDPVIVAGMIGQNSRSGQLNPLTPSELTAMLDQGRPVQLVDVREPYEFALGALPGAINIPIDEVRQRMGELDHQLPTVVYDGNGSKGYVAARILGQALPGPVYNLSGGFNIWSAYQAVR